MIMGNQKESPSFSGSFLSRRSAEGDKGCWDTPAPPEFEVFLRLADGRGFRVHVNTSWAPVFAQRFWQLSKLRCSKSGRC